MNNKIVEWVLRIAVAGEFIGHGVFALQGKKRGWSGFRYSVSPMRDWQPNFYFLSG